MGIWSQLAVLKWRCDCRYVIQRFLDAQRIHNLTAYLQVSALPQSCHRMQAADRFACGKVLLTLCGQALHEKGVAHSDHTTLLLNCYTKLKDVKKLDDFIKHSTVDFDVCALLLIVHCRCGHAVLFLYPYRWKQLSRCARVLDILTTHCTLQVIHGGWRGVISAKHAGFFRHLLGQHPLAARNVDQHQ